MLVYVFDLLRLEMLPPMLALWVRVLFVFGAVFACDYWLGRYRYRRTLRRQRADSVVRLPRVLNPDPPAYELKALEFRPEPTPANAVIRLEPQPTIDKHAA